MDFKNVSDAQLISDLSKHVSTERKSTEVILWHIHEMERRKLHLRMGYASMFDYLTKHFGYCESSAYRRIQASRLLTVAPEICEKLEAGSLNLTQVTKVATALKKKKLDPKSHAQTAKIVLSEIENKSKSQTEKIIAEELDLPILSFEKAHTQKNESVRLELTLSKDEMELIEKAKAMLSHQLENLSVKDLLLLLVKKEIKKHEGKEQVSQRASSEPKLQTATFAPKSQRNVSAPSSFSSQHSKRKRISIKIKRELFKKANHQCQYQDPISKRRCTGKTFLQTEHAWPLALDGTNEIENLRVFCQAHNQLAAEEMRILIQNDGFPH